MRTFFLFSLTFMVFSINIFALTIDSLQVEEARKSMEKAFTDYANYISSHSSEDDYAIRLYHNYVNLKEKYEEIRDLYQASKYSAKDSEKEYFFSPHEEASLQTDDDIKDFLDEPPSYISDYRLGWLLYINGDYKRSLSLFDLSIKKATIDNIDFLLPYLGIAQVYLFLAERSPENKNELVNRSKKAIDTFTSNYYYSDDIEDKKRRYLAEEIKKRLNFLVPD